MTNTQELTPGPNGKAFVNETIGEMESRALRSANAIAQMAHRAAEQIDKTAEYIQKASQWTMESAQEKSKELRESMHRNPVPLILGATVIGFGIGYLISWKRSAN